VVASITINYRQAIVWPAMITVTLKPQSPGRSSIKLEHEIRAANGTSEAKAGDLYADAATTLVWVDRKSGDSIPLPQAIRDIAAAS
jgi:acyl-CoA thioester hydrolase